MLATLSGRRVLIVEDEYFIAEELSTAVRALGATIVGPTASLQRALELLGGPVDLAILDINLNGESSFAIAAALSARGVPFLFATGYDAQTVPPDYRTVPRWEKPFDTEALVAALAELPPFTER
ncbi:MAG TPA: response regulator [Devosia sp.]|nr:response regulator [Devosia sp.]